MNNFNTGEEEENVINSILEKGLEEIKKSQSNHKNNNFKCSLTSSLNNINNNNSSSGSKNQNKLISPTNQLKDTSNIYLHNSNNFNNITSIALHKIITNIQKDNSIEHNPEKLNEENGELLISKSSVITNNNNLTTHYKFDNNNNIITHTTNTNFTNATISHFKSKRDNKLKEMKNRLGHLQNRKY